MHGHKWRTESSNKASDDLARIPDGRLQKQTVNLRKKQVADKVKKPTSPTWFNLVSMDAYAWKHLGRHAK